jgi:hypothetical protein
MPDSITAAPANAHYYNRSIRTVASLFGAIFAVGGITHGYFEFLQGDVATGGVYINSIGPEQMKWPCGDDPALTLIQNFRTTGIVSMIVGVLAALWSILFIQSRHGTTVFLALFVILTLVGGGIGFIPFYLMAAFWVSRINRPLARVGGRLSENLRAWLQNVWVPTSLITAVIWLNALLVSVTGAFPGIATDNGLMTFVTISLLTVFVLMNVAFAAAAARDIGLR